MLKKAIRKSYLLSILGWAVIIRLFFWDPIIRPLAQGTYIHSSSVAESESRGMFYSPYDYKLSNGSASINIKYAWAEYAHRQTTIFSFYHTIYDSSTFNVYLKCDCSSFNRYKPLFYIKHIDYDFYGESAGLDFNNFFLSSGDDLLLFRVTNLEMDTMHFLLYERSAIDWVMSQRDSSDYPMTPISFRLPPIDTLTLIRRK